MLSWPLGSWVIGLTPGGWLGTWPVELPDDKFDNTSQVFCTNKIFQSFQAFMQLWWSEKFAFSEIELCLSLILCVNTISASKRFLALLDKLKFRIFSPALCILSESDACSPRELVHSCSCWCWNHGQLKTDFCFSLKFANSEAED